MLRTALRISILLLDDEAFDDKACDNEQEHTSTLEQRYSNHTQNHLREQFRLLTSFIWYTFASSTLTISTMWMHDIHRSYAQSITKSKAIAIVHGRVKMPSHA
ncbi:hypothetical protein LTR16_004102 [Cryomyces antarcticus]|uniref:Uncharacterized protein n=1 Tax=Cryomyces antarcticus TaxID=329879 RepID=A0ABR0LXE9_9PEZI|nr:hypothetical protein LTR39_004405 [Cryomyces antarcticus]KAK5256061.1 hypothetical protein LTR16_004102 [Cryomyces antarcticus]